MYYVEMLETMDDGSQKVIGEVRYDDKNITFEGLPNGLVETLKKGIVGYRDKYFTPADGMEYMNQLKVQFSGTYLRATDVKER